MKSNPYKIDDAEEFEPTLASPVKSWERDKIHTLVILYLPKSLRWTGRFYYSGHPADDTLHLQILILWRVPTLPSYPYHHLLLWDCLSSLKALWNRDKQWEEKGEWALHPICAHPCLSIGKRKKKPWSRGLSRPTEDSHNFDQIKWREKTKFCGHKKGTVAKTTQATYSTDGWKDLISAWFVGRVYQKSSS